MSAVETYTPRLKDLYQRELRSQLQDELGKSSIMAGVIPVIFAAAVMAFPPTMAQYFPGTQNFVNEHFSPGDLT